MLQNPKLFECWHDMPQVNNSPPDFMWWVVVKIQVHWKCCIKYLSAYVYNMYIEWMNYVFRLGFHPQDIFEYVCVYKYFKYEKIQWYVFFYMQVTMINSHLFTWRKNLQAYLNFSITTLHFEAIIKWKNYLTSTNRQLLSL